jgi:hypothetical protein
MKIEEEDYQKQQAWLEQRIEENKSSKKEQERETATFMYKFDQINDELQKIELRTKLKKRYVVQQQILTKTREAKK